MGPGQLLTLLLNPKARNFPVTQWFTLIHGGNGQGDIDFESGANFLEDYFCWVGVGATMSRFFTMLNRTPLDIWAITGLHRDYNYSRLSFLVYKYEMIIKRIENYKT